MASDTAADYDAVASSENSQWPLTGEGDSEMYEQDFKKHIRSQGGQQPFECEVCSKHFLWQSSLTVHMRIHTRERPFCCMLCNSKFSRPFDLKQHLRTHTGEQPFCCEICKSSFARRSSLKQHLLIHTGDRRFSCKVCKCNFQQASALKAHMLIHSDKQPTEDENLRDDASNQPDDAEDGKQSFTDSNTAADHYAEADVENNQQPITCEVGSEKFQQLCDLDSLHTRSEAGEGPFECEVCSKSFLWQSLLKRHMRIHTGERPFSCKVCKCKFTQSSTLTDHMRVHTGERPFSCKVCKSSFAYGSNLKRHMRTHKSETEGVSTHLTSTLALRSHAIS